MQLDKSFINTLAKQREVPYEVMFKLSDAIQDPTKKNRYWFNFPSQWADQVDKDPIIGIRDMYLTKTNRFIDFDMTIQFVESLASLYWTQKVYHVTFFLEGAEEINSFCIKFNSYLKDNDFPSTTSSALEYAEDNYDWNDLYKHITCYYYYDANDHQVKLRFGKTLSCPESVTVNDTSNQTHTAYFKIGIQANNEDTIALFGSANLFYDLDEVTIPIWSRYNCYLLSSLAENDVNGFLGHTRPLGFTPIKYYRMHSKNKKFWIELYETRYHDVKVTLPIDNIPNPDFDDTQPISESNIKYLGTTMRDDLFIEAIVCFSSSGML